MIFKPVLTESTAEWFCSSGMTHGIVLTCQLLPTKSGQNSFSVKVLRIIFALYFILIGKVDVNFQNTVYLETLFNFVILINTIGVFFAC